MEIPDNQKYQIVVDVYTMQKTPAKRMCKYLTEIKPLVPPGVLETIKDTINTEGNIVVYRGGVAVKNPSCCLSWTLSEATAEWFAKRYLDLPAAGNTVLYKGIIKADDVIAYTNEREEQEIIQYRSVKRIKVIREYASESERR